MAFLTALCAVEDIHDLAGNAFGKAQRIRVVRGGVLFVPLVSFVFQILTD
jgi:hypothetical protein